VENLQAPGAAGLLHRPDQARAALLDQVREQPPPPGVPPGQRHHQPQVGLHQVLPGRPAVRGDLLQAGPRSGGKVPAAGGELAAGEQAGLDPPGQLDLRPGGEQPHPADLLQVVLYGVRRNAGGCHPGGGKTLVVITGNRRLVLAGARFLLTGRLRQSAGLTAGRA